MLLRVTEFLMEPGDQSTASPPIPLASGSFSGVQMVSDDGREGQITFSPVAILDGSAVPTVANVTGLYPHEYDIYSRYVYIEVPRFNSQVEYSFNIFIPAGSSANEDSGSGGANSFFQNTVGVSLTFALIAAAIVVFCILITLILIKRRRRHSSVKQRVKK